MSDKPVPIIQVLPLPDGKVMMSSKQSITGINNNNIENYNPNGLYEITASSYSSNNYPYHIAGSDIDKYWECGTTNSAYLPDGTPIQYKQPPYTGSRISSPYQGGGSSINVNTWTTPVGKSTIVNVRGEWIQIRLPYDVYINRYTLRTPQFSDPATNTFPSKFVLVGSNDGTSWTRIDQQLISQNELPAGNVIQKGFDINSPDKYSYFRLIIIGMGSNVDKVRIQELRLSGTLNVSPQPKETFVTLNRAFSLTNGDDVESESPETIYQGINPYDRQYGKYNLAKIVDEPKQDVPLQARINNPMDPMNIINTSIIAGIALTSVFIYTLIDK